MVKVLLSRLSRGEVVGGAELSARDITRSLLSLGESGVLLTNCKEPRASFGLSPSQTVIVSLPLYKNSRAAHFFQPIPLCWLFFLYIYIVIKQKPDILHPHSRDDQVIATVVGKLFHKPVVWRDPGDLAPQLSAKLDNPLAKLNRKVQVWALGEATAIYTLNEEDRVTILKKTKIAPEKISVIGSNILFEDYTSHDTVPKDTEKTIIGVVCRLERHKGVHVLIDAFQSLPKKMKENSELWIIGDGTERQLLEEQSHGDTNIRFFGHQKSISPYLASIDIYVQPSEFEGWGRSVKEAMYFKLPVIGSSVGGIAKQVVHEKTGFLYKPNDTKELALYLKKLLQTPKLRKDMGTMGHTIALRAGDWKTTVKQDVLPILKSAKQKQ